MAGALPPVVAELVATNTEFMAKMAESKAAMEDVSKSGGGAFQKLSSIGGAALAGIAGGAVAVGAASVVMSVKFQDAMEQIHTQAGASQAEVDKMSTAILNMAGSVGTGPDELAAGLYHIESAGLRGAKALDVLKVAAEGAKVGHADLEDVTNALDGAIVSGIKGVQNYSQAMGALNAIVGSGDMRMQDLATAMGTGIAAVAKTAGMSLTDVGAALAVFGDNNIRGSKAAIYLRQAITGLVAPSAQAKSALGSIGIGSTQLGEDLRKPDGLMIVLDTLKQKLESSGMDATQQAQVLAHAFGGAKSSTGIEILLSQLDRLKSKYGDITKGANSFGADWQAEQKTAQFQLDQLGATMEATGIKIGNWLLPKLEDMAHFLENGVTWLEKNKDVAIALGVVIGGALATAIGAFTVNTLAKFITSVGQAASTLTTWLTGSISTSGMDAAATSAEGDATTMGTSFTEASTAVQTAMEEMAAAVAAAAEEISASLTTIDGEIATTKAEMSGLGGGGLVGPTGAPISSAATGAASGAEGAAAGAAGGAEGAAAGAGAGAAEGAGAGAAGGAVEGAAAGSRTLGIAGGLLTVTGLVVAGTTIFHEIRTEGKHEGAFAGQVSQETGGAIQTPVAKQLAKNLSVPQSQYNAEVAQIQQQMNNKATATTTAGDRAKDSTLKAQMAVLTQMKGQLAADTAKYGAGSVQAHNDAIALSSTANKWGAEHGISLKGINGEMTQSFLQLVALKASQAKLEASGSGNLEQSKYIKAVLENQLSNAKAVLSKDETAKASKQAIDQARQKVTDTETAIRTTTNHIDTLKAVADQITKTKDTYDSQKQVSEAIGKVNTDTSKLHSDLSTGIPIIKMPSQSGKLSGSITLKVG